jgi:hypothetical protein
VMEKWHTKNSTKYWCWIWIFNRMRWILWSEAKFIWGPAEMTRTLGQRTGKQRCCCICSLNKRSC